MGKKICFITTVSMTLEIFVLEFAKHLYESGVEVFFVCDNDELFRKRLPSYIHYIPIKMKRGIDFEALTIIYSLYKILKREKFDLVQYSTPNASLYGSLASFFARVPNRLYCQWGIAYVGFKSTKRIVFKTIEKLVCTLSTKIEPDSYSNQQFSIKEKLYRQSKSEVIWNGSACGVNLNKFDLKFKDKWNDQIRSEYHIANETVIIGYVGRITKSKGLDELLLAFKQVLEHNDNLVLLLVGNSEGSESLNKDMLAWASKQTTIYFCGETKYVERFIASFDVLVLPSYREGFGSVTIEAQAMGVPVIATRIPGPVDAVIEEKTGLFVEKGNVDELREAILVLVNNRNKRITMGNNGYYHVLRNFEQSRLFSYLLDDRLGLISRTNEPQSENSNNF